MIGVVCCDPDPSLDSFFAHTNGTYDDGQATF